MPPLAPDTIVPAPGLTPTTLGATLAQTDPQLLRAGVTAPNRPRVPGYEIQPNDLAHSRPADGRDGFAERKQRVWNVLGF